MSYQAKLKSLRSRRSIPGDLKKQYVFDSALEESLDEKVYSTNETDSVKYSILSMQPVPKRYTEISFEEGDRVANSLINDLTIAGIRAEHDFQGSVPLDIHIKGVSDVDVLVFHDYLTYEAPVLAHKSYTPASDGKSMLERMRELRLYSESILTRKFPAVDVDTSKAKAINMQGGSLRREVDIVPAHWRDTRDYQSSGKKEDREVFIYDKAGSSTISNWPFKHMSRINIRDSLYRGNLKKISRLLKNIKADSEGVSSKRMRSLSSYDIASLVYQMGEDLSCPAYYDLGLLAKVSDYLLRVCANNFTLGESLITPDGSRRILNSDEKQLAALELTLVVNKLYKDVLSSIAPFYGETDARRVMLNKQLVLS